MGGAHEWEGRLGLHEWVALVGGAVLLDFVLSSGPHKFKVIPVVVPPSSSLNASSEDLTAMATAERRNCECGASCGVTQQEHDLLESHDSHMTCSSHMTCYSHITVTCYSHMTCYSQLVT